MDHITWNVDHDTLSAKLSCVVGGKSVTVKAP